MDENSNLNTKCLYKSIDVIIGEHYAQPKTDQIGIIWLEARQNMREKSLNKILDDFSQNLWHNDNVLLAGDLLILMIRDVEVEE